MVLAVWLTIAAAQTSECPTVREVEAEFARILPGTAAPDIELQQAADTLSVRCLAPDGSLLLNRTLAMQGSCAEKAKAAAVIVAAWASQAPLSENKVATPVKVTPAPVPLGLEVGVVAQAWLELTAPIRPGFGLWGDWFPHGGWLGLHAGVFAHTPIDAAFGPGQMHWYRLGGELGPVVKGDLGPVRLTFSPQWVLARFSAWGTGFDSVNTVTDWDGGAKASFRVGLFMHSRWHLFIDAHATLWARPRRLTIEGVDGTRSLSRWTFGLGIGAGARP
ncbi:MAG: hypothetical protein K1X64_13290 [Myxococcaceae bacterium]|nr:hypothetical protein [Myxococcaceae bacterium]